MVLVDDNEIEETHEQDVEAINYEDLQEILSDFQEGNAYITDSFININEEDGAVWSDN